MDTVLCEYCGREIPRNEAQDYDGVCVCNDCWESDFVDCERCGEHIHFDNAYRGFGGYLCENCHDELF